MKKRFIYLFLFICLFSAFLNPSLVKADSGWDSSYDSGGSSDFGGSDSWSSSDSSWSSSSGGSYSSSGNASPATIVFLFIIIVIVIYIISKKGPKGGIPTGGSSKSANYPEASDDKVAKIGLDRYSFKSVAYQIYLDIQNAWMNFDYEALRKYTTDEIYNTYVMDLDALKLKHNQNKMSDFDLKEIKIVDVREENKIISIDVYLNVEMYDYVIDKDNIVVRGDDDHKINIEYIITFVKENATLEEEEVRCPNCGAKVKAVTGGKCSYCGSVIVVNPRDYVMSKKTCINQRRM